MMYQVFADRRLYDNAQDGVSIYLGLAFPFLYRHQHHPSIRHPTTEISSSASPS